MNDFNWWKFLFLSQPRDDNSAFFAKIFKEILCKKIPSLSTHEVLLNLWAMKSSQREAKNFPL